VKVLVSGDLDEFRIQDLIRAGAPIDGFGVGGNLGVGLGSIESGTVGGVIGAVYKLAWYGGDRDEASGARIKLAGGGDKSTWPGQKQTYRVEEFDHDVIALQGEPTPAASRPLLETVIAGGHLASEAPSVRVAHDRAMSSLAALPQYLRELEPSETYPVAMSAGLQAMRADVIADFEVR
jgi:nicotinate phosphoribosyltransferase